MRRGLLYTMGGQFLRSSFLFRRRCVSEVQGSNPTSSRLFISSCESSESSSALRLRPARLLTLLPHTPALSPSRDPAAPDPDPPLLFALASVLALLLLLPLLPPILLRPPTRQSRCFCCSFCCSRSACAFLLICVVTLLPGSCFQVCARGSLASPPHLSLPLSLSTSLSPSLDSLSRLSQLSLGSRRRRRSSSRSSCSR